MDASALARLLVALGALPGDLTCERGGTRVYVPLTTMLIVSLVLTLLVNLVVRLWR